MDRCGTGGIQRRDGTVVSGEAAGCTDAAGPPVMDGWAGWFNRADWADWVDWPEGAEWVDWAECAEGAN